MKGAARLQRLIRFSFLITALFEVKVGSEPVISGVKPFLFRLSLFCRVGGVADPVCNLKFHCSCCTRRWMAISTWVGMVQGWKQSTLDSVSPRLNGTHTLTSSHTARRMFLILSTSSFLWEDTDTPWMSPWDDLQCGWEVPNCRPCLEGQYWSLSHAVRSPL